MHPALIRLTCAITKGDLSENLKLGKSGPPLRAAGPRPLVSKCAEPRRCEKYEPVREQMLLRDMPLGAAMFGSAWHSELLLSQKWPKNGYKTEPSTSFRPRNFKSFAQLMVFATYDIVSVPVLNGWITIGLLAVLLWHTRINDIDKYLDNLTRIIDDLLNITAQCAPSIIVHKPKFHFLLHFPMYIRRFAITCSTERYESFNHVFRLCSIHSNKRAPSRDTCKWFGTHDIIKHVSLGGYWFDGSLRKWCRAGSAIVESDHQHASYLALSIVKEKSKFVDLPSLKSRASALKWSKTRCSSHTQGTYQAGDKYPTGFYHAISMTAKNGDDVHLNKTVIVTIDKNVRRLYCPSY